ncbi:glycosyltransferase [Microcoleus sp. Pol11C1]|uniref:O-linked N-acetylglucosamine transferase family protein n=1 Tax=unclassified Microcoleus TaxID=2642155 RepID=UPI002FD14D08
MMKQLSQPASYPYTPMHKHYGFAVFQPQEISPYLATAQELKNSEPNCIITWFTTSESERALQNNPYIDQLIVLEGSAKSLETEIPRLQSERSWSRFFTSEQSSGKRILLGQLGLNGDCLHATTLARQIKHDYPNCHLTWAISSMCRSVIEENPFVDEIWEFPANNWQQIVAAWYELEKQVQQRLNRGEFDEVFLTQVSPNNYQNYDGTTKASLFRGYPKPITVPIQNILRLRTDEIERVRNFAEQHNLLKRSHVILFEFTGSSSQSFVKPEYALSVAQSLLSRLPDCSIILSSNLKIPVADARIIDGSVLTLRENAELTKYCSLLIGCSSGVTQTVLTDWAKPLPMIQLLLASTSVYASIAHDLEYWQQSSEQVLEMTDCSVEHAVECAYTALVQGFPEARRRFHQQIPLNFNFYFNLVRQALLQNWQFLKAARSVLHTTKRYGWHPQLKTFVQNELIPKIDVNRTLQITPENYSKFLQEFVGDGEEGKKVTVSAIAPESASTQRPFWSVIIPTYNPKNHYLEQTLKSVLEQAPNSSEMQIEVVDDCSANSEVEEIVKKVGNGRISFYKQSQNLGQIANWNDCIQRARGNWVHILHQDDIVLPGFYNSLQTALETAQNVGAAFCRHYYIDAGGNKQFLSEIERETAGIIENFLERIAVRQRIQFASIVVKRSVYQTLGGFSAQAASAADWEMWKRIASHCKVWYEPQILACFRLHSASETSRLMQSGGNIADAHKAIKISQSYLPQNIAEQLSHQAKEHYAIEALKMAHSMIARGEVDSAIAQIREGLKCSNSSKVISLLPAVFLSSESQQHPTSETQKQSPKIIIDGVMFQLHKSGITRVWHSLITEWASQSFSQHILVLDRNGTAPKIAGINYRQVAAYDYSNTESDREMLQQICDEEQADLFISTYYTTPRATPSVFMAYDMIPEVMGANLANPMWKEKHQGIRHASAYLAISENTARDLVKCFPDISQESVTIAHCGIDRTFLPSTLVEVNQLKTKYGISKPYFLWVGDRVGFNGYKNAVFFFKAFSQFGSKHLFEIVCVGGNSALETELQAYTSDITVHLLKLSDDELRSAYSGALALVQTSKYEGFGLPLLEAIACGCPVITSPNSSIPEVLGQAALYVNGEDVDELTKAFIEIQNFDRRQLLIAAGLEQVKKFSWSEMATKVSSALIAATQLSAKKSVAAPVSMTSLISIVGQYQSNQSDSAALANVRQARKQIADIWLNLLADQLASAYSGDIGKAHQALLATDIRYEPLTDTEETFVSELVANVAKGFNEPKAINYLLAAMLYLRADQLSLKYDRATVPNWFANEYLKFMFTCPNVFQSRGEADTYYLFIQGWIDYLHSNLFKNTDSPLWQNIALLFAQVANFIPLYFTTANLRDIYTKRAEIIEFSLKNRGSSIDCIFPARSPNRTKIRLGIINDHFAPQTETFATIPVFEHLNRNEFEIYLYALNTSGHQLEQYCQSRADKLVALPKDFASQVQTIRADDLDILFFGTNLTAINKPLTSLAIHRLARVQTTSFCSPTTTGIRHMDYYIAGQFTAPDASYQEQYREQLAVLQGSGFCFKYATESEVATVKPTRQSLGISDNTTVFISGANFYKILPELRETWVKILAAVPDSILILYPFGPAWTRTYPATPFVNNLNAVCAKYGVNNNRLRFLKQLPSRADVKEFLQLADVYLDSYPYAGATSLIDPLQVGLPAVVVEGNALRFRQGSAMLRELQMPDLIAYDEASYIQLAVTLGTNPQLRQQKRQEIQQKMQGNPRCFDSVAYSGAIGKLFQQLFGQWQTSHLEASRNLEDSIPKQPDLGEILSNALKLYQRNSSNISAISELRQIRKQIADFWLNVPTENLETAYKSTPGNSYKILLKSDFQRQPMMESEQMFLQQLTQISKGLVHPKAVNALLAAMLYFPQETMRIPDARNRLPHWLIGDYEQVFETESAVKSDSSSDLLAQYIQSPQFANQLLGCVNLYRIDPSDESVVLELRQIRKQMADFWLTVPSEKLENFYRGEVRKGYQAILGCGLQAEAMTEAEQKFLQQLTDISKGLVQPQAINALLGAMLYFVPGKMRVPDARTRLPQWLLEDYEKVFESAFTTTEQPLVKQDYLPQFLNQLTAAVNLYEIDPTAELVIADLRQIRKQIADLWLSVSGEQVEVLYQSDFGKGYKAMLGSGFINEPLHESDREFFNSLVAELSKGFGAPKAVNNLLAAMMYCRPGQLRVQDANTCLPPWLLEDYEQLVGGAIELAVK